MSRKLCGIALAAFGTGLWGLLGVFVRILEEAGMGALEISFLRCALSGAVYLLYLKVFRRKALHKDIKTIAAGAVYGIICYGLTFVTYNIAVTKIPVAVCSTLGFMCPVWVMLLNRLILRKKAGPIQAAAAAACVLGAALVSNVFSTAGSGLSVIGLMMGVINGCGVALRIFIPQCWFEKYDMESLQVYGFLGAAGFLLPVAVAENGSLHFFQGLDAQAIWAVLLISILCTLISNLMYVSACKYISSTQTGILSCSELLVSSFIGVFLYNENLSALQYFGIFIVVVCAISSQLEIKTKQRHGKRRAYRYGVASRHRFGDLWDENDIVR